MTSDKPSDHDAVIYGAKEFFETAGKVVCINPGSEQNKCLKGYYIDVIVRNPGPTPARYWVIEAETENSVSTSEAKAQWKKYAKAYNSWWLAVPAEQKAKAELILDKCNISNCTVLGWEEDSDGTYTFDHPLGLTANQV